ncbi:MAG: RpiB/LacA/LacB family sugar-phosphate isomerase [Saprospiraceae bacterium]|nr:RpiB/LacA/LacB family sugar-phosphate isomerase [Saprospiraceae bacterium]
MKIGIAADHGGFALKEQIIELIQTLGHEVIDFGALTYDAQDDYPDFIIPLAQAVTTRKVHKGIAVCGSGVGAAIAANKVKGARASVITDSYSARQGVEHDAMNIMCLGGRITGIAVAEELVKAYVDAAYTNEDRHNRRLGKVETLENNW